MNKEILEILDYWFIDEKNECWRDRRTNKVVQYFNKEKKMEDSKEDSLKAPDGA